MQVTEHGLYWDSHNNIIKVQPSHTTGRFYGKLLVITKNPDNTPHAQFEYRPGLLKDITAKMTLDEAVAFGKQFGFCCVCGRLLTNALSIELGIGPICRGYF